MRRVILSFWWFALGTLCGALGLIGSIQAMQNGKKVGGTGKEQVMKPMKASQMFGAKRSPPKVGGIEGLM